MAGNTRTRDYSWRDWIVREDPDFVRNSRYVIEYEFQSSDSMGDERTHRGSRRVFQAYYDKRGIYAPEVGSNNGLTWGTIPIIWGDEELIWGDA